MAYACDMSWYVAMGGVVRQKLYNSVVRRITVGEIRFDLYSKLAPFESKLAPFNLHSKLAPFDFSSSDSENIDVFVSLWYLK